MVAGAEKLLHNIFIFHADATHTFTATFLCFIFGQWITFHISAGRYGNNHIIIRDKILDIDFALNIKQAGASLIPICLCKPCKLIFDDVVFFRLVIPDKFQVFYCFYYLGEFIKNLLSFKAGQPRETHFEDRFCLYFREGKLIDQPLFGRIRAFCVSYQLDNGGKIIQSNFEPVENMPSCIGFCKIKQGSSGYYFPPVFQKTGEYFFEV